MPLQEVVNLHLKMDSSSSNRGIRQYFVSSKKPSEVLKQNDDTDDVVCLTPVEKEEVLKELKKVEENCDKKRSKYKKYTDEDKTEIGKYAYKHGVSAALKHFDKRFSGLKQQTVSDYKRKYGEITKETNSSDVVEIKSKKRGRPSLLPDELMTKTIEIIKSLRLKGAPVSYAVMAAVAKGVVMSHDRTLLVEHGGYLCFSNDWARQILHKVMKDEKKMSSRIATTASLPIDPAILSEVKLDFQRKIKTAQETHNIPDELIINFDQTPLAYKCGSNRTMEFQGTKSVPIVGKGKKEQITGTFTVTKTGVFLPMQLIWKGKTKRSIPKEKVGAKEGLKFPDGFNLAFTKNHWSNEEKAIEHIEKIVVPYVEKVREELNLETNQKALLIFDVFRGQKTQKYLDVLKAYDLVHVFVPANMTSHFQPLDLTINGIAKTFLKDKFGEWYAAQVQKQLGDGSNIYAVEVKLSLSVLKPIHARWLISLYDHLRNQRETIIKGFDKAGISEAISLPELEKEDPFHDLV